MKVLGPYTHSTGRLKGRKYVTIIKDDGKRTSKLYSRYLKEQELGRTLLYNETVDHDDEDLSNDALSNLKILLRVENVAKYHRLRGKPAKMTSFICPGCGQEAEKPARLVNHNRKQGKAGPFCGRECGSRAGRIKQLKSRRGGTGIRSSLRN